MVNEEEIRMRIDKNKQKMKRLDEKYINAYAPKVPSGETSYFDCDIIHGSRKEYNLEEYYKKKLEIEAMIELDTEILKCKMEKVDDELYLSMLKTNLQKVKYLRIVRNYTQEETSEMLGISERHVQRIERELKPIKMSGKMSGSMSW